MLLVALFSSSFTFSFDERHGAGLEEGAKKKQWRLFIGSTFGPFESWERAVSSRLRILLVGSCTKSKFAFRNFTVHLTQGFTSDSARDANTVFCPLLALILRLFLCIHESGFQKSVSLCLSVEAEKSGPWWMLQPACGSDSTRMKSRC